MTAGTYTLLIELARSATIAFGALGKRDLDAGWYAYVGSAFGPGGFARIDRHRAVAAGENATRHWHVDYLLGHPDARVVGDVRTPGADVECRVAGRLAGGRVPGVGVSDCTCDSHLAFSPDRDPLARSILAAHEGR